MWVCYFWIIALRSLKAFHGQPRLALVTKTLIGAASEAGHFGLVLALVVLIFAAMAMVMFGSELSSFATVPRALVSTLLILLAGEMDWEMMVLYNRVMANVW